MVLILDPRFAVVWRTPWMLQVGVDQPRARVDTMSAAKERMLAALRLGITRSGLEMIGMQAGADSDDVEALLAALGPTVVTTVKPIESSPLIAIDGAGPTAERLAALLPEAGFTVVSGSAERAPAEVVAAVLLAHFVITPPRAGAWLRRDIPHLPVIFGDTEVGIGPLISPGVSPCWHCVELHRRDLDPARVAIAAQLLNRRAAIEQPLVAWEIAALVTRILVRALGRERAVNSAPICSMSEPVADLGRISRHFVVATGAATTRPVAFHPECGCQALPGTVTAFVPPAAPPRIRHTTAAARVSPV